MAFGDGENDLPMLTAVGTAVVVANASAKIKQLSEYVTIKILDANMPIIFVLAYQFGLRNILDYMGVKYTVTEGRTKLITAESGEAGTESLGVDDLKVPEKLSDQLLQVTAQQVKLRMKELYGLDTSATKVVVSRQNYYRDGTPCKKDAANEWGGCYVPKLNTVFINEASADVIRNWFKSERLTYQKFTDFLVRILAHELTHSCFGKSAYTATLNGLIKTANSAKFSTVYLDSLDKTNKNYTEELCCEYVADKVVDSLTSTESLGTEDFKETILRLLGNYPLDIYFTLAEKGDVLYVSRLTLIDSKTKKSKGELVIKENEYHKVAYYDNIRNDKHTAYQVLSYFQRGIMDYLKFHKGAYRKYTIEPDATAKKLLEKYFGKLEQPKGSKNDTPDNRKRALEIVLKEWKSLAQKDMIAAAASDDVSDNCGHLADSWVKQESDIGNLLDTNGFFMDDYVDKNGVSDEDAHEQITAWVKKVVMPTINPKIKSLGYALISMDDSFVSIVPIDTVGVEALDVTANTPAVLRDIYQRVAGCKYGFWDDSINRLMDVDNESDDAYLNENARILTPQEVLKYQVGTCWDQSLAIAYLLSQEGIKFTYLFMEKPSNETHTFVVAEVDGKYYWIETAWARHKGIHAAPTENKALELAGADFFKTAGDASRGFTEAISAGTVKKCWQNKNLRIAEFLKLMNFVYFNPHKHRAGNESLDETVGERRYTPKPGDIAIKFADKVLWFNRYPLKHSLIVAGLDAYDLSAYEMAEFESKDIYYQLLLDKGESINYLKGIDGFYELFIDNMTYSVLKSMHEPTNFRDLLIRAAELLTTKDYRPPSSRANHRIRGYEQFNAVLYNEMSRQFAAYRARRGRNNKFSVNPDAIYLRIVQNASMIPSESPNPLQDLKEQSYMTYAGVGGRTSDSFVVEDRKYSKDDVGVISEATVDNQKVGINAQLSLDPAIVNTEGLLGETTDPQPANIFSIYALAFPFATHDDTKRINSIRAFM